MMCVLTTYELADRDNEICYECCATLSLYLKCTIISSQ